MSFRAHHFIPIFFIFLSQLVFASSNRSEEHVLVSLRVIGHEILLASGDSTSRVLPIQKVDDQYQIQFSSAFSFDPQQISNIIDSIVVKTAIASQYLVEVQSCDSKQVVYSYQVDLDKHDSLIPCRGRLQPEGCYIILFSLLMPSNQLSALIDDSTGVEPGKSLNKDDSIGYASWLFIATIVLILGTFLFLKFKRKSVGKSAHLVVMGNYVFDQKKMTLFKGKEKLELTGKETDLLQLLYLNLNSTVDRDLILKEVWKDEGDYIGRTLDVYISKLRKKLESDPAISIINVRGVGYKLTLD